MSGAWEKIRKLAGEAWRAFLRWLRDDSGRMLFGIMVAMFGAIIRNSLLIGFGLGVVFSSALALHWRRKGVERVRA